MAEGLTGEGGAEQPRMKSPRYDLRVIGCPRRSDGGRGGKEGRGGRKIKKKKNREREEYVGEKITKRKRENKTRKRPGVEEE